MDKKIIKGLIDEKLEVIQDQFSIIKEYEGKIPVIEIDLLMTSIRDLYELVLSLQFENTGGVMLKPEPQPKTPKTVTAPAPVIKHNLTDEPPVTIEEPVEEKVEDIPPADEPIAPVFSSRTFISMEPVSEEEPEDVPPPAEEYVPFSPEPPVTTFEAPAAEPSGSEPAVPEPQEPPAPVSESEQDRDRPSEKYQKITFDLFTEGGGSTLADRLRDGQEKRVADKLQENKVLDLRTTIGINDKFLFINELFEGNMRIYDEAIQKLNASTTMAQADILLLDLKIVYNWDSESPTVKKFVELVRRKF